MTNKLEHNLSHSRIAYRFAVSQLPPPPGGPWPMTVGNFTFEKQSEVHSMQQEYGWAFFCRYEGCVEAYLKKSGVRLSKSKSLQDWFSAKHIDVPKEFTEDLATYRTLRNALHHDDGASPDDPAEEIDLPPPRMEGFYKLFVWVGCAVAQAEAAGQLTP